MRTIIASLTISIGVASAQVAPPPRLAFEVSSVKANDSATMIGNRFDPERAQWTGMPLRNLIEVAYGLNGDQITGGPSWVSSDRWDVEAKSNGPTTMAQKMAMLQTLLEERFQLQCHREVRLSRSLALTIARGGPKLHEVKDGEINAS